MEFKWQYAKELFSKLSTPDYGTTNSWNSWYEQAWGHLSKGGLTKVETPLDLTRIKLRIAATCWLSLDFVAAMQGNEYCNTFYWSDWISDLGIDPTWAIATAIDDEGMREVIQTLMDSKDMEHEESDEEGIFFYGEDGDDIGENLDVKVVAAAAEMQRDLVWTALIDQLDGSPELFLCLYTACADIESLVEERKDEIESEIDDLQEDLDQELLFEPEEAAESVENQERIDRLRKRVEARESKLDDDSIREMIMDELREKAFSVSGFGWEDEDDIERMRAFEWCETGCEIINKGEG